MRKGSYLFAKKERIITKDIPIPFFARKEHITKALPISSRIRKKSL
jgi:hypothetical protein